MTESAKMTRGEWLDAQRERGLDVDALLELGMDAFACDEDCDYEGCRGWTWGYDYAREETPA